MKITFTFLILFSFSFTVQSQRKDVTNYLLLGLLNDYNGRLFYKSIHTQVEHFYPFEEPLVEFIDSLLSGEDRPYEIVNKDGHFYLNSPSIAKFVNSCYTFKTDSSYILANPEKEKWELKYTGLRKKLQITNLTRLKSFIVGSYIRHGERNNEYFVFRFVNSVSTSSYFLHLITRIGCSNITTTLITSIPSQRLIQFKPTPALRSYIEKYEYLRARIIKR